MMPGFGEGKYGNSFEDHPLVHVPEAYTRAQKVLSNPVNPNDFEHYRDVPKDLAHVAHLEKIFEDDFRSQDVSEQNFRRMGTVFEAIMFEHIELSDWLGANATTVEASRYDDYVNKVDSWVEFDEGDAVSHLAMAFDVTTSHRIRDKLETIRREIESGTLTSIKYFISERLNFKGSKGKIPRVILGADRNTVYTLADLWMRNKQKELGDHPIQFKILYEMKAQLEAFGDYAKRIGKTELEPIYRHGLEIVNGILEEKSPSEDILVECEKDDIYNETVYGARNFSASI